MTASRRRKVGMTTVIDGKEWALTGRTVALQGADFGGVLPMNKTMTTLSVVIPTLGDRPDWRDAVASVRDSGQASGIDTEIVLVWQGAEPPDAPEDVIVVPIRRVGVSYARNRGAEHAGAGLIAYIDDDELVDPTWAGKVVDALGGADAAFGPIEPFGDDGRPHCPTDFGKSRIFEPDTLPWLVGSGGNMVFRRRALEELGGFDLHFGPGAIGRSAEETDIIRRLLDSHNRIRWAAEMIVYHPTKSDEEIAASRHPYGFGAGRMLRSSRSPRLIAAYMYAVAGANLSAMRKRDPAARRESRSFALGLAQGLTGRLRWISPELSSEQPPDEITAVLAGRQARPLPVSLGTRPHYIWDCGDAILHAYIGPSEAQLAAPAARERILALPAVSRIPRIHAHVRSMDVLWVLEDRIDGEPLEVGSPARWWPEAVTWVKTYARHGGPPCGSTRDWTEDSARWIEIAPETLRDDLTGSIERMATQPTSPSHGDLQPKNLVGTPEGLCAVDWEWCTDVGLPGMDLVFLATTHAGIEPDPKIVRGLLRGSDPPFGKLLEPLAALGLAGPCLKDALMVMLAMWAANERRSTEAFGATPRRPIFRDLLRDLTPDLQSAHA